jgi:phage-related protein
MLKDVAWVGSSKADLSAFPSKVKVDMGYQIHLVQTGQKADDWKPLKNLGKGILGVYEIRLSTDGDIFRTAYVTKFGDCIAVLHCWQKKTQTIAQSDKELIVARYREAKEGLS